MRRDGAMLHVGLLGDLAASALPSIDGVTLGTIELGPEQDIRIAGERIGVESLLGVAALGEAGARELARFAKSWRSAIGGEPPPALALEDADPARIACWVAERSAARIATLAQANVALRRQLTAVRRDYDTLQGASRRLEQFISEASIGDLVSIYTSPATDERLALTPDGGQLVQLLPVAPFALAGLDLYLDPGESSPSSVLHIAVRGRDTERTYAAWRVSLAGAADGWTTFSAPAGLTVAADTLELVAWSETGTVALAAGPLHPIDSMTAHVDGRPTGRALAFKVWQGLPGVAPPVAARGFAAVGAETGRIALRSDALREGTALGADGALVDERDCVAFDQRGRLSLRPAEEGALAYVVHDALPPETRSVYLTIMAGSPAARGVQAAVAAMPEEEVGARGWLGALDFVDIGSRRAEKLAFHAEPSGRPLALVVAVRAEDEMAVWFAEASVLAVEIEIAAERAADAPVRETAAAS